MGDGAILSSRGGILRHPIDLADLLTPLCGVVQEKVLRNFQSPMRYRWAFIEQCLLILFVSMLALRSTGLVLTFFLPWYVLIYFISRSVDYLNHYGCNGNSINPYERANNSLNRLFNRSSNNFGYHTAHHLRPSAHWTELPTIHEAIAERIPERLLKPFSWSCLLLPYHWVLSWRGRM